MITPVLHDGQQPMLPTANRWPQHEGGRREVEVEVKVEVEVDKRRVDEDVQLFLLFNR